MSQESHFCIRFHLAKLEGCANQLGITGGDWRQQVLDDLLYNGKLRGEMRKDPKTANDVWWFFGRRVTIVASIDQSRNDALFVIDIYRGAEVGGRKSGQLRDVPGPWRLATLKKSTQSPPIEASEHLYALFRPRRTTGSGLPTSGQAEAPSQRSPLNTNAHAGSEERAALAMRLQPMADSLVEAYAVERPILRDLLGASDPGAARRAKIAVIEQAISGLQDALAQIPSQEELDQIKSDAEEISDLLHRIGLTESSTRYRIGPAAVLRLLRLFENLQLQRLPGWVMYPHKTTLDWLPSALDGGAEESQIIECAEWVRDTFGGATPDHIGSLTMAEGSGPRSRLDAAWVAEAERRALLESAPIALKDILAHAPLPMARTILDRWQIARRAFSEKAVDQWLSGLSRTSPEEWLVQDPLPRGLSLLSDEDADLVRNIDDFARAAKLANRLVGSSGSSVILEEQQPSNFPLEPSSGVRVEHAVTDVHGHIVAAAILLPELKPIEELGRIRVPVRVRMDETPTNDITLDFTAAHLAHMPEIELRPGLRLVERGGQRVLQCTIAAATTVWHPLDGGVYTDTIVEIPAYRNALDNWRSRKTTEMTLVCGGRLTFKKFVQTMPEPPRVLDVQESPSDLVKKRPLGVQLSNEKLERLVRSGGPSFMVVAPRRFGKTTLLKHLSSAAKSSAELFVVVADLGRHLTAQEGLRHVLQTIVKSLNAEFGSAPHVNTADAVLSADMFTEIRRFVADHHRKTIAIFVDEAQVLVPRQGGVAWGNTLKNQIEHHLTGGGPKLADVFFILFGTVDLSIRMGRNCRDFLRAPGHEAFELSEESLARYIRVISQGALESSSLAREELASWTNNLVTLNLVLEKIFQKLRDDQRTFFLDADVRQAVRDLLRTSDMSDSLSSYASAELSYSDEWEPIDAFPLAVAWAREEILGRNLAAVLETSLQWLNDQLAACGYPGTIARERAEQCLADLQNRGIVRDSGNFRRQLLRELLRRNSESLLRTSANILALQRMSVDLIEWPAAEIAFQAEGGQARVFLRQIGDSARAYRTCRLETPEARKRFARTCAAIRRLLDRNSRMDGDAHLPRVREAGFRADDPHEGVIVYDWIQGEALGDKWLKLSLPARVFIAMQLAMSLDALHSRGVLHCDVHPRNVVVDGQMRAVLVDFGLARTEASSSSSALAGHEFAAPELSGTNPIYSSPADVYAIGVLIQGDGREEISEEVGKIVQVMMMRDPQLRPTAKDVAVALREISENQQFDPRQSVARRAIDEIIEGACDNWMMEALLLYADAAVFMRCGYVGWNECRAMEAAFYLDGVFAQMMRSSEKNKVHMLRAHLQVNGRSDLVSLNGLRNRMGKDTPEMMKIWCTEEVKIVGTLRNAWAHPAKRKEVFGSIQRAQRGYDNALEKSRECILHTAGIVDDWSEAEGVIRKFFGALVRTTA